MLKHFPEELLGRVPAVYLKSAEETILAVLPFIRISMRGVRDTALFNFRRLHHCKRIHFSPTLLYARPLAPDRSRARGDEFAILLDDLRCNADAVTVAERSSHAPDLRHEFGPGIAGRVLELVLY